MIRAELKIEALCETCPETLVEIDRGEDAFGLAADSATLVDFQFTLEFTHGWEIVQESYAYFKYYCPACKAKRNAAAA